MYFSVGTEEIFANYFRLLKKDTSCSDSPKFENLKKAYLRAIKTTTSLKEEIFSEDRPYRVIDNYPEARILMECYSNDSMLDDMGQDSVIKNQFDNSLLEKAQHYTDQLSIIAKHDYALCAVFDLTINYILVMPSDIASGGSSSALPGVIWINPRDHWNDSDQQELLIHELTHNLLFVDELVHGLFKYQTMANKENWSYSAVLAKKRPLDKSFHSAVVATEVLLYRHAMKQHPENPSAHPPTNVLLQQTRTSLKECGKSSLMLPRAQFLLRACEEKLNTIYQPDIVCNA